MNATIQPPLPGLELLMLMESEPMNWEESYLRDEMILAQLITSPNIPPTTAMRTIYQIAYQRGVESNGQFLAGMTQREEDAQFEKELVEVDDRAAIRSE